MEPSLWFSWPNRRCHRKNGRRSYLAFLLYGQKLRSVRDDLVWYESLRVVKKLAANTIGFQYLHASAKSIIALLQLRLTSTFKKIRLSASGCLRATQ